MPTSLPVDPMTLSQTPFERGWYGDKWYQQYTYWQNTTRMPGGNPVICYNHGGGWTTGGWNSLIEGVSVAHILLMYLLRPDIYGSGSLCFDVVTFETRLRAHGSISNAPLNSPQEVTIEGTNPGTGVVQASGTPADHTDDAQRFVQFLRDRYDHFDIDPGDIALWGESAGGTTCLNAALAPTRRYTITTETTDSFDAYSNSLVRGVLNWIGPVSFDPWDLHYSISGPAFGVSGGADPQGDMEILMLGAAGLPDGSPVTSLCKKTSPIYRAAACPDENLRLRIFSVYDLGDLDNTPGAGYGSVPPFTNPHDPRWYDMLDAACVARGIDHDGINTLNRTTMFGGSRQLFYEATLPQTKAWLDEVMS